MTGNVPETHLKTAEDVGFLDGLKQGRKEILDWLEEAYIKDEGRPDRGSDKANAILELARDAARHIRSLPNERKVTK